MEFVWVPELSQCSWFLECRRISWLELSSSKYGQANLNMLKTQPLVLSTCHSRPWKAETVGL